VDLAVSRAIKSVQDGTFKGGTDVLNNVANNGVGIGKIGPAGTKYAGEIKKIQFQIAAGKIKIPDTVK
jgi:basic membrane lipoprotein Med (substrate-binding protein (PBP1-ABC) superfamily)